MGRREYQIVLGLLALLGLTGCTSTGPCQRLYAWCGRDVRNEPRLYDLHDPFPDESAGPDTVTRPRDFDEPRSDTRRDFDLRLLLSMVGGPEGPSFAQRANNGRLVSPIAPAAPLPRNGSGPLPAMRPAGPIATQQPIYLAPAN